MVSNLIRVGQNSKNMNEEPFQTEEEMEKLLLEDKNILSDISFLGRQIQNYTGSERIDLWGLDNDNNIVIMELKNKQADEDVILQVMRYAFWIETHPDTVQNHWYRKKDDFEDLKFDWGQKANIRILIIAPSFNENIKKLISRVKYDNIQLIELKKFNDGEKDFIFLNQLETGKDKLPKASSLRYSGEYDEDFYKSQRNIKSVPIFMSLADKMENYLRSKGWNLTRSNNRSYISFKAGFPIVCSINWIGSKSIGLVFKIPKEKADELELSEFPLYKYESEWKQAVYKVDSDDIDFNKMDVLFEAAYKHITGK